MNNNIELWEIGLNSMFIDFYDVLYDPFSDRERCCELIAEIRGYITALYFTEKITQEEKHLIHIELRTMIDLVFNVKLRERS